MLARRQSNRLQALQRRSQELKLQVSSDCPAGGLGSTRWPGFWRRARSGVHPNPGSLPQPTHVPSRVTALPPPPQHPGTNPDSNLPAPKPIPGETEPPENREHRLSARSLASQSPS